jgi:hypothetical protein
MWATEPLIWFTFTLQVLFVGAREEDAQNTLSVDSQSVDIASVLGAQDVYDYGIGIGLGGSYGTISISYSNGTKMNLAKIDGSETYNAMFKNFSLEASQHIHPPYQGWDDASIDWPRLRQRKWNKAHGLPASEDVGVISSMISNLVTAAQLQLGHNITEALAATPNLVALYQEDVVDAFEHSGLQSLDYWWDRDHVYHETAAAVAGNGFGLCQNFKDIKSCRDEDHEMPLEVVFSVSYTAEYLCVELADMISASYVRGHRMSPPTMDFTLGLRALHDNPSEMWYWEAVRDTILRGLVIGWHNWQPKKVFVLGDQSHHNKFRAVLEEALLWYNNGVLPEIFDSDPVFRATQGAAEMARRRRFVG